MKVTGMVGCGKCAWGHQTRQANCSIVLHAAGRIFPLLGDPVTKTFPQRCIIKPVKYVIYGTWALDRTSILVEKIEKVDKDGKI